MNGVFGVVCNASVMVVLALGDLMLGVLLLDINLLESCCSTYNSPMACCLMMLSFLQIVVVLGTMVPIGTIDARLIPFGW
jgi:hypothetical protein